MDGFFGQALSARKGCLDPTDPTCANSATLDVMGHHKERDIPNCWTYAKSSVLQNHMFELNASAGAVTLRPADGDAFFA